MTTRAAAIQAMRAQLAAGRRDLTLCRIAGWRVSPKALAARTGLCEATIRAWIKRRRCSHRSTTERIHRALVVLALEN